MVWLIVLLAIVVGLGAFLAWVGKLPPTEPVSNHWPWSASPDVVTTDRALQRASGKHPHGDDDGSVVL